MLLRKIPRFAFEKFKEADSHLTTQMKSVGEVMAIGGSFKESLQKALRGLEIGIDGFTEIKFEESLSFKERQDMIFKQISTPSSNRILYIAQAFRDGMSVDQVFDLCYIDQWFLYKFKEIVDCELSIKNKSLDTIQSNINDLKSFGFSDKRLANLLKTNEVDVRNLRKREGVKPVFKE